MSASEYTPWLGVLGAMGLGAAVAYYNFAQGGGRIDPVVDLQNQTMEISTAQKERVSRLVKDGKLVSYMYDDARTLYEGFRRGAKVSDNGPCLGMRKKMSDGSMPYQWMRYNEVLEQAANLAAGFIGKGLEPGQQTFIGIYATNCSQWIITEQACYVYSNVIVPLYDTLGPDACSYIINQADIRLVVCDKSNKAEGLLDESDKCPNLKVLVICEELTDSLKEKSTKKNVEVISFDDLIKFGANDAKKLPHQPPKPEDLATICYTSGTTGLPKGVMLTHANIVANCSGLSILKHTPLTHDDIIVSYLPLAHMFERILEAICFMVGARIGFFQGDIRLLTDDIKVLRPTLVPVVPRLLNRIYDKVMSDVGKSGVKKFLFDWAFDAKTKDLKKHIIKNNTFWDKLVFRKIRDAMGGNVRLMVTGSAPCAENVLTFIRASMGCVVLEGYGQTECVAAACCTLEGDHLPGHVGPPLPCSKVKLVDVPEMEYYSKNGQGEVCIYGPNVFKGYFKDPEKTAEALDSEGWLHTGDIGRWTPEGTLKIIDRKKNIFKLAQGEYIAPEKIENIYMQSKYVAQAYVHGESLKSTLVAIIVPDFDVLTKHAAKEMNIQGNARELCKHEQIKQLILNDITAQGKKTGLHTFEQVKEIHLHSELFTIENGLLTPTFKSKRPALRDFFKDQIAELYRNLV